MKTRRFLACILSLCMIFTMLPAARLTASAETDSSATAETNNTAAETDNLKETYKVWLGGKGEHGIKVTADNCQDVLGDADDGATVTYTPATGYDTLTEADDHPAVLTLNGLDLTTTESAIYDDGIERMSGIFGIYSEESLIIELADGSENTLDISDVKQNDENSSHIQGIHVDNGVHNDSQYTFAYNNKVIIRGNGTLNINMGHSALDSKGIYGHNISIQDSVDLSINMKKANSNIGLRSANEISIIGDSKVTINTITDSGTADSDISTSYTSAIDTTKLLIENSVVNAFAGNLFYNGSDLHNPEQTFYSHGITASEISITENSEVTAKGGNIYLKNLEESGVLQSFGNNINEFREDLFPSKKVGSEHFSEEGIDGAINSIGIYTEDINIRDSSIVTASGGDAYYSHGIYIRTPDNTSSETSSSETSSSETSSSETSSTHNSGFNMYGGTVKASGNHALVESSGIHSESYVNIQGGTLEADTAASPNNELMYPLTTIPDEPFLWNDVLLNSYGIYAKKYISVSENVNASASENTEAGTSFAFVTAQSIAPTENNGGINPTGSYGIYSDDYVLFGAGTVNAESGIATENTAGVYANLGNIEISGSDAKVTATAGRSAKESCGIAAAQGDIVISSKSTVNASSGGGAQFTAVIRSGDDIDIIESSVTASGGTDCTDHEYASTLYGSYGIAAFDFNEGGTCNPKNVTFAGSQLTATGGTQALLTKPDTSLCNDLIVLAGTAQSTAEECTDSEYYTCNYVKMTAAAKTIYDVWVNGIQVTEINTTDVLGDIDGANASVVYTPATDDSSAVLTLNNAVINGTYELGVTANYDKMGSLTAGILAKEDITITLADGSHNEISISDHSGDSNCGIYAADNAARYNVVINGNGSLSVKAADGTENDPLIQSAGIYAGNIDITGDNVSVETASGNNAETSYGMDGSSLSISAKEVISKGGTASSGNFNSRGIYVSELDISGGTVTAFGYDCAIYGTVVLTDGTVTASSNSNAIFGALNLTGGTATVSGDHYAINGTLKLTGGTVTAFGGEYAALIGKLDLTGYSNPFVTAGTNKDSAARIGGSISEIQEKIPYNYEDQFEYKYLKITTRPSSGGSSTTTTTTKNEDGSKTTTTTNKSTGTVTETTTYPDGSVTKVETKKDGTVTTTQTDNAGNKTVATEKADGSKVTEETRKDGTKVVTEITAKGETTAKVEAKKKTEVIIPVENAEEVTKVVVTDASGKETEVEFEVKDGGVAISVSGNSTVSVQSEHISLTENFTDVDPNAWYHDSVNYILDKGLMKGVADDKFAPNESLTRAMLVTILYRAEGEPKVSGITSYSDLEPNQYYLDAVCWAQINGIVNGTTETTFAPNDNITREQIAVILYRYRVFKGVDAVNLSENLGFADADEISSYAISAMNWAAQTGLIKGYENNAVRPLNNATRAEAAALIQRFLEANK